MARRGAIAQNPVQVTPLTVWRPLGVALASWVLVLLLSLLPLRQALELREYDILNALFPAVVEDSPVVIVGIDEPSFDQLNMQWPWPRGLHGDLINALREGGAAVIGMDVVFAEPSNPENDDHMAKAIADAGNVVLAADVALQETEYFTQAIRVEPTPQFRQAGGQSAVVAVSIDTDRVVRAFPFYEDSFWYVLLGNYIAATGRDIAHDAPKPGAMIRYLAPGSGIKRVSYYQALDAKTMLPDGVFKDKIVLVGLDVKASPDPTATQTDSFATPLTAFTGFLTPGVEVHANLVANALYGLAIRPAALLLPPALAGALALLLAFATWRWTPLRGLSATALALAGLAGLAALAFRDFNRWIPILQPVLAVVLVFVGHGAVAFLVERRRRLEIKGMFGRYLSPALVEQMTDNPDLVRLGGEKRRLTLMFTDIAGFTSLSEKLPPEQVAVILNDYLTRMTRIILDHGGTVDKFIGDAIMAFWGAPLEDEDQARHAVRAGIAMRAAMAEMNREFKGRGWPPVNTRMGIHSGLAVVGNMGSEDRFDYTAIGDDVNLASRLEGINKLYGTDIALSAATVDGLGGEVPVRFLDRVRVKGKSAPVDVFTLSDKPELADQVSEAFRAYEQGDWTRARTLWSAIAAHYPEDQPARLFLARIEEMTRDGTPEPWDGAVALEKM